MYLVILASLAKPAFWLQSFGEWHEDQESFKITKSFSYIMLREQHANFAKPIRPYFL